jgi:hypothetical protein
MLRFCLLAGLLTAVTFDHAAAQEPTQAQRDAIRASCRSDFIANCSGVEPGGREALECLMRNDAKLSAACREAVSAVTPVEAAEPAAPAAAPPPSPEVKPEAPAAIAAPSQDEALKAVQNACTLNDVAAHCSWIAPTNPEILLCLKANAAELSPGCQAVVQSLPAAAAPAAAPPPPPPVKEPERRVEPVKKPAEPPRASAPPQIPPAAAAPTPPSEQQKAAIRAACRSDFMAHCSGVQPGGAAALQCLQRNAGSLSGRCRSAVAAIGGGGAAPSAGAPAAAATPSAAPIGPMPMMRPREALAILRICGPEARTLCAGVPMGGGRILSCLAENASSLSPDCYSALRAAASR